MAWRLKLIYDDGTDEIVDDVFETEEDAERDYDAYLDNWAAGRESLKLAGEDYIEADIEDCEIWEE